MEAPNGKKFAGANQFLKVDFNSTSHFNTGSGLTLVKWAKRPKLHKITAREKKFLIRKLNKQLYRLWKHPDSYSPV